MTSTVQQPAQTVQSKALAPATRARHQIGTSDGAAVERRAAAQALIEARQTVLARTARMKLQLAEQCASAIGELVALDDWQGAIQIATRDAGVSQAEIARNLEVMRSTVTRWAAGQTTPPAEALPHLSHRLKDLIFSRA